ncbi:hypothetical protein KR51_00018940, partial [Rubidibacter lacunae KORDI 51-2]
MVRGTFDEPCGVTPDRLTQFVDELREAGYNIGIAQYVAVHDLLLTLTARGELRELSRLRSLLGPILCCSPEDQQDFPTRFDQWVGLLPQQHPAPASPERVVGELSAELDELATRSRRIKQALIAFRLAVGLAILVPAAVLLVQFPKQEPEPSPLEPSSEGPSGVAPPEAEAPNPPEQPTLPSTVPETETTFDPLPPPPPVYVLLEWDILLVASLTIALGVIPVWKLWWRWRARLFLQRRGTTSNPELHAISIQELEAPLFKPPQLLHTSQQLRCRIRQQGNVLDVARTVRISLQQGGWLTPIYKYRQVMPEYLFLVDRINFRDHQAQLVEATLSQLQKNGVYITLYFFDGDPRVCYASKAATKPLRLQGMPPQYGDYQLVVISDAENFFNSQTGELETWVEQLHSRWQKPVVLTQKPIKAWKQAEWLLSSQLVVLPMTMQSFRLLGQLLREDSATYIVDEGEDGSALPEALLSSPRRWIARNSPSSESVSELLLALKEYLGEHGFYWLCACAVFPEVRWPITLFLGNQLTIGSGQSLLKEASVQDLARLPWFRYGYIPDWLRNYLVAMLTPKQEQSIRSAFQALLVTATNGDSSTFEIEIARQHQRQLSQLANPLLRLLSRRSPAASPYRDHMFLDFMRGRSSLAVEAPEQLFRLFPDSQLARNRTQRRAAAVLGAVGIAITIILGPSAVRFLSVGSSVLKARALHNANNHLEALAIATRAGQLIRTSDRPFAPTLRLSRRLFLDLLAGQYREKNRLEGHSGTVFALAYSPDG